MYNARINQTTPNSSPRKQPNPVGFPYPSQDHQDTLHKIWQSFKQTKLAVPSESVIQNRSKTVYLMMQCHKLLKLPIQTLYLSVSVFDRVLNKSYLKDDDKEKNDIYGLGISCLYSCQKLEKIRNYGVSYWLKNISLEFLASIGFPHLQLTSQLIKRNEASIMQTMNYNLFCNTPFDILLGIWTIKPPTQQQFYFSQYFLELSLLSSLHEVTEHSLPKQLSLVNSNTATSITQKIDIVDNQQNQNGYSTLQLVLAVVSLSKYFISGDCEQVQSLVKMLWDVGSQENCKKFQNLMYRINLIANKIFQKALIIDKEPNCKTIYAKYGKQVNLSISHYKFQNKCKQQSKNQKIMNTREDLHTSGSSIYKSI